MKKSKFILSGIIAIGLSISMAFPAFAAIKYKGTVSTSKLNVRVGPSTTAKVVKSVNEGDELILVAYVEEGNTVGEHTANMTFYKLEDGGYVAAKYIKDMEKIEDGSSSASSEDDLDDDLDLDDDNTDDLDGDEEDEEQDGLESVDDEDAGLEETGSNDDTDSQVSLEDDIPIDDGEPAASAAVGTVLADSLKVRVNPSTSSTIVKKLQKGEKITITQSVASGSTHGGAKVSGNWYKINTGGFVAASYIKVSGSIGSASTAPAATVTTTTRTGTATAATTMYSKPNTLATKKGTLAKGKSMAISSSHANGSTVSGMKVSGNWYKLSNGYYVSAGKIRVSTVTTSSTSQLASSTPLVAGDVAKSTASVNVRSGPGTNYGKVKMLANGATDNVVEIVTNGTTVAGKKVSGTWAKLEKAGGYVSVGYLALESKGVSSSDSDDDVDIPIDDSDIPVEE